MQHERFHYRTLDELKEKAKELGIQLPLAKDTKILMTPYTFGRVTLPNRVGIAPTPCRTARRRILLRAATCVKRKAAVRSSGLRRSPSCRREDQVSIS